jgi:hypothetical protein
MVLTAAKANSALEDGLRTGGSTHPHEPAFPPAAGARGAGGTCHFLSRQLLSGQKKVAARVRTEQEWPYEMNIIAGNKTAPRVARACYDDD